MLATFDRFEIEMTEAQARGASHQGRCDEDVAALVQVLAAQLDALDVEEIRCELREYGAWDDIELSDDEQNRHRIVWLAAGQIKDEMRALHGARLVYPCMYGHFDCAAIEGGLCSDEHRNIEEGN